MVYANFSDIPTDFTLSIIISELAKFILYNKQQIPFTYDKLSCAVKKRRLRDSIHHNVKRNATPCERLFQIAEKSVDNFEEMFQKTAEQLSSDSSVFTEIALLFGGSIFNPKQIYKCRLPVIEKGHLPKNHCGSKIMSDAFKSIIESEKLHNMFSRHMEPTNMFIMLRACSSLKNESSLIPKPKFCIPSASQQIDFNFSFEKPDSVSCCCKGFQVFLDQSCNDSTLIPISDCSIIHTSPRGEDSDTWYQVPLVFKGFKDVFVHGISVSKSWLNPENTQHDD